ncbi:MAG: response regulator [Magnetococcales bacterium]|nr:response regulator [Magnetococcales bacterium]
MVNGKRNRHVALVVEDHQGVVDDLAERLHLLGHDMVAVPSQEEALALLEAGQFCYILLDLQILVTSNTRIPRLEAGQSLLRSIREQYPARNKQDRHCLQIIVMSGFAKEMPDAVWCLQNGADDFIAKPFDTPGQSITAKIGECLQRSSRTSHAMCPIVMELGKKKSGIVKNQVSAARPLLQLSILGGAQWKRTGVIIGDKELTLPDFQLVLLLKLVAARVVSGHGWVHKISLGSKDDAGFKGIAYLNSSIQPFLPDGIPFYENDKQGSYRINPCIAIGKIDHEVLVRHRISEIRNLSSEITGALAADG